MTRSRIALATVVTLVWVAGYVIAYIGRGQTPQELSGLMVIVLGWAFAGELKAAVKRRLNGDDNGGDDASRD
jgi:hypothetical protein